MFLISAKSTLSVELVFLELQQVFRFGIKFGIRNTLKIQHTEIFFTKVSILSPIQDCYSVIWRTFLF